MRRLRSLCARRPREILAPELGTLADESPAVACDGSAPLVGCTTLHDGQPTIRRRRDRPLGPMHIAQVVHAPFRQIALRVCQHHKGTAGRLAYATITVPKIGVEVDGIAGRKFVLVAADDHPQFPADDVEKLESLMHVRPVSAVGRRRKLSQVRLKLALSGAEIEPRQVEAFLAGEAALGRRITIIFARDGDYASPMLVLEEVLERDFKHSGDPQECGDGRHKLTVFDLR